MYLTYKEYIEMGGELSESAFKKYSYRAEMKIKEATYNRIDTVSETVKKCAVILTDIFESADVTNKNNVASFSHDGLNQSFVNLTSADYDKEIRSVINAYLSNEYTADGIPLLYRGCDL